MLSDPEIEIVVNLTTPDAHYSVAKAAIEHGKSVYNEKPVSISLGEGGMLLEAADKAGVLVGGAPDTFMGGGIQTCRKLIDDGWIGEPIGASAFMTCHGHEVWHPDPEFYYKVGGEPMFDSSARITFPERTITSEPKRGTKIKVEVPTHVAGLIDFHSGAIGTVITSFDVWAAQLPRIEIYGSAVPECP